MMSFAQFAKELEAAAKRVRPALKRTMTVVGMKQIELARSYIGQEMEEWPPLADVTVQEKERLGYTGHVSDTDPLLRTGKLRDSIEAVVTAVPDGVLLDVGSNDKVAVYQEMGTATIPPRPFLALSAIENEPFAKKALAETAVEVITGKPMRR